MQKPAYKLMTALGERTPSGTMNYVSLAREGISHTGFHYAMCSIIACHDAFREKSPNH